MRTPPGRRPQPARAAITRLETLLARYAGTPGVLDALSALSILGGPGAGAAGRGAEAPTLTELALAHLRAENGRGRAVPPLSVADLFERRAASFSPEQARSRAGARGAGRFFCRKLGAGTAVAAVTGDSIRSALARFKSPATYNAYLRQIKCAMNLAVALGAAERSPAAEIEPKTVPWTEPAFFGAGRAEAVFRTLERHPGAAESGIGAFLTLGFFAGVRSAEALRAQWEDIDLDAAVLRIPRPKGHTKGRRPRLVELEPNAVAWLAQWRAWTARHLGAATGRIVRDEHDVRNWKALRLVPSGLSWGNGEAHNAPRHTYATMHVAAFRDAAATALNLGHGNGTEMLEKHYLGLAPKTEGEAYWRIFPAPGPLPPPEPLPGRGWRSDLHPRP